MPMYPIKCRCGFEGDRFAKIDDRNDIACPKCDQVCDIDWSRMSLATTAKTYVGTTNGLPNTLSMTEGFNPKEVAEARSLMGDRFGACIADSGEVHFRDRTERDGYLRRRREVQKRGHANQ